MARTIKRFNPWFGILPELGGYGRIVVADSEVAAKTALMDAWKKYDAEYISAYRGQVHGFDDLAEIYGAYVKCMPWNQWIFEGV